MVTIQHSIEGINMNPLVKLALDTYKIDAEANIKVDYWSNQYQTFLCSGFAA